MMNLINRLATSEYSTQKQYMLLLIPIIIKNFQSKNKEIIFKYYLLILVI